MAERPDDDPFEMRRRRPPEEKEGGYQDTSIDDAERDFGLHETKEKREQRREQRSQELSGPLTSFDPCDIPPPLPPRVEDYPQEEQETEKRNNIKLTLGKEIRRKDDPELFDNIEFVLRETPKKGTPKTPESPTINSVKLREWK